MINTIQARATAMPLRTKPKEFRAHVYQTMEGLENMGNLPQALI